MVKQNVTNKITIFFPSFPKKINYFGNADKFNLDPNAACPKHENITRNIKDNKN